MAINEFYIETLFTSKVKLNIDGIRKATKKGEAKTLYKVVFELLSFGVDANIINQFTFDSYINDAKDALWKALH